MFKKLGEVLEEKTDLLTVRCTKARLDCDSNGVRFLEIQIADYMEAITSTEERAEHIKKSSPSWLRSRLASGVPVDIATPEHPLEVITGDIAPVLVVEGERYLISAFRDIPPIGWIIPGGCPKNLEELLNPRAIAFREFWEELPVSSGVNPFVFANELPAKGGHASRVQIYRDGRSYITENVNVTILAETASVAVTFYWELYTPAKFKDLRLVDGERLSDGTPLNRPVRLTDKSGKTVAIFVGGRNILSWGWHLSSDEMRMFIP